VAIEEAAAPAATRDMVPTVAAGNRVVVNLAQPAVVPVITPTTEAEVGSKLAWRVPRLEFNETALSEVVGLLNRQSGNRINLASPELGRVEISGALRADNIEPLLQMLETNYGIRVVRAPDGRIELQRGK
jgi:ferric-dicitrate binding protein FerR (iron transport regulator)